MMIMTVGGDTTTAVTNREVVGMTATVTSREVVGMAATAMFMAGVCISHMATVNEFMSRLRFTMNRLHRRASASFYHSNYSLRELNRVGSPGSR